MHNDQFLMRKEVFDSKLLFQELFKFHYIHMDKNVDFSYFDFI